MPYLVQIEKETHGAEFVVKSMRYLSTSSQAEDLEESLDTVVNQLAKQMGAKIMTLADTLMERGEKIGFEKGMAQGVEQGILKGKLEALEQTAERGAARVDGHQCDGFLPKGTQSTSISLFLTLRSFEQTNFYSIVY